MLTYKSMNGVIADQVKNLKLVMERKKDEHENLLNALREIQSEGQTKERVGKLYFIIMLSRWQEASVNKKYEAVLGEAKSLRSDNLNKEILCENLEASVYAKENMISGLSTQLQVKIQEAGSNKGTVMTHKKALEYDRLLDMLSNEKSTLEIDHMKHRSELREMKDKVD